MSNRDSGFPNAILIVNVPLLSLLYLVGPITMKVIAGMDLGDGWFLVTFELAYRLCVMFFWVCVVYGYQVLLHILLAVRIKSRITWAVLFLWPILLIGGVSLHRSLPLQRAQTVLSNAGLASLPESATEIKVFTWSTPFSGEEFLRFRASREDIESFLAESAILKVSQCQRYSKDRMRLIYPDDYAASGKYQDDRHEYFFDKCAPPWYIQEIKGPGRRYRILPKGYNHAGEVIFNEEENLVFVNLVVG
jgi:hypothetical protein